MRVPCSTSNQERDLPRSADGTEVALQRSDRQRESLHRRSIHLLLSILNRWLCSQIRKFAVYCGRDDHRSPFVIWEGCGWGRCGHEPGGPISRFSAVGFKIKQLSSPCRISLTRLAASVLSSKGLRETCVRRSRNFLAALGHLSSPVPQ